MDKFSHLFPISLVINFNCPVYVGQHAKLVRLIRTMDIIADYIL